MATKPTQAQEAVLKYFKQHEITEKLNEVINKLAKVQHEDPFGFMIKELEKMQVVKITQVVATQAFDSRGNPTVEVTVTTNQASCSALVPSGASTGIYEALELRDGGDDYHGKGVFVAVKNVNEIIAPALIGRDPRDQEAIDRLMIEELDGTKNDFGWSKSKLGANAILGVSLAVCRAGASAAGIPLYQHIANLAGNKELVLPVPSFNIINGGTHAGNKLAMQEFMILPTEARSFSEAMKIGTEVYHHLKKVIKEQYGQDAINVGDEGGFAPNIVNNKEALDLIATAIENAGYTGQVQLGMDVAASEFYSEEKKTYDLNFKNTEVEGGGKKGKGGGGGGPDPHTSDELADVYRGFVKDCPMVTIEDPFDQNDWQAWAKLTADIGQQVQIVGDDLLVTNPIRVKTAIEKRACNALLLKVNQIGSVTESIEAVRLAKNAEWGVMCSHRSGETEDSFIADLAVGLSTGQIKSGAPCRSERLSKYNRLLRIEQELGNKATYAGTQFRRPAPAF